MKKRQEVGRGMRLAVNQAGDRVHDEASTSSPSSPTRATSVSSHRCRREIEEEFGKDAVPPKPATLEKRATAPAPQARHSSSQISRSFGIGSSTDSLRGDRSQRRLIPSVLAARRAAGICHASSITKAVVDGQGRRQCARSASAQRVQDCGWARGRYAAAELGRSNGAPHGAHDASCSPYARHASCGCSQSSLTRRQRSRTLTISQPARFAILKQQLADHLVDGIQYTKVDEWYEMSRVGS